MALRAILLIVAFGFGSLVSGQDSDQDLSRMQGNWEVASLEIEGIKMAPEGFRVHIDGDRLTYYFVVSGKPVSAKFAFQLRPNANPKSVNAILISESKSKLPYREHLGIYSIEGDTLKLCLEDRPRATRPTAFQTQPGSNLQCFEMRRMEAEEQDR